MAVNPVPRESDLTHGDVEEISAAWAAQEPIARPTLPGDEQTSPEELDRRQKIWRYLLAVVFVCFVAESLFSNLLTLKAE